MKCDNCGKEEVNFHYTSNINGNITEKHLCAECAGKLGVTDKLGLIDKTIMNPDMSFEEIFKDLFGVQPGRRMFGGYGVVFPTFVIPTVGLIVPAAGVGNEEMKTERPAEVKPRVDEDMKRRREINVLREQMRQAAEAEDFEKAAALRDSIRKLEEGVNL